MLDHLGVVALVFLTVVVLCVGVWFIPWAVSGEYETDVDSPDYIITSGDCEVEVYAPSP